MPIQNEKAIVALIKFDHKIYLMMTKEKPSSIVAFASIKEGMEYFQSSYNECHERSYEASMSACINFIQFTPKLVEFNNLEELISNLEQPVKLFDISSISGRYTVVKVKLEEGMKLWELGITPLLISRKEIETEMVS